MTFGSHCTPISLYTRSAAPARFRLGQKKCAETIYAWALDRTTPHDKVPLCLEDNSINS